MTQYDLYGGLPPHIKGSATSKEAAILYLEKAETVRAEVYRFLKRCGEHGATDDEIHIALGLPPNSHSHRPRRIELTQLELVADSGKRRPTRAKRQAVVWVMKELVDE
jgi:hypothetical protein